MASATQEVCLAPEKGRSCVTEDANATRGGECLRAAGGGVPVPARERGQAPRVGRGAGRNLGESGRAWGQAEPAGAREGAGMGEPGAVWPQGGWNLEESRGRKEGEHGRARERWPAARIPVLPASGSPRQAWGPGEKNGARSPRAQGTLPGPFPTPRRGFIFLPPKKTNYV